MATYTIRPGFTIPLGLTIYIGGEEVDLTSAEFELHKHKLEGTESSVIPIDNGGGNNAGNGYPAPYFTHANSPKILTGQSKVITLDGSFFTPDTTVDVEQGAVTDVEFVSDNELKVTITAGSSAGNYDLILNNGTQTIVEDAVEYFDIPGGLVDLRLGGTNFSNSAIEMRPGMNFTREADGLFFSGVNLWGSWARFVGDNDNWVWNRSTKKTLSWIFSNSSRFMLGIGSRANAATNNQQYYQAELLSYVSSGTNISSLYGNNGNPGSGTSQSFSATKNESDIVKVVFKQNGENGGIFQVYILPGSDVSSWFDTSNQIGEVTIAGFGSNEPNIMPFAIQDGNSTKFLGFILEDE